METEDMLTNDTKGTGIDTHTVLEDPRAARFVEDLVLYSKHTLDPSILELDGGPRSVTGVMPVNESNIVELIEFYRADPERVDSFFEILYEANEGDSDALGYLHAAYGIVGGKAGQIDRIEVQYKEGVEQLLSQYDSELKEIIDWMDNMDSRSPYLGLLTGISASTVFGYITDHGAGVTAAVATGLALGGTLLGYMIPHAWGNHRIAVGWKRITSETERLDGQFCERRDVLYDRAVENIGQLRGEYDLDEMVC